MLENDMYSSYVTITPSMIIFDGYSSTTQIFELEIYDDAMIGVLSTGSSSAYIDIRAEISGTTSYDSSSITITEAP